MPQPQKAQTRDTPAQTTPGFRRMLLTVALACTGLVAVTAAAHIFSDQQTTRANARIATLSTVRIETTVAHLWLEEILSGDTHVQIEEVWRHFGHATDSAHALLDGHDISEHSAYALPEGQLRDDANQLFKQLKQLRALAGVRYEHSATAQPGSEIDERFDRLFAQMVILDQHLHARLNLEASQALLRARMAHAGLVCFDILLAFWLVWVLRRYERSRQAARASLEQRERQLRQAQKMELVGNLAGGIAHDFNNLLQAILGYSSILTIDLESEGRSTEEIEEITSAALRAAELTRQLLGFSRRQVISPVDLDLNSVVTNLLKMLGRLIGEHVVIETALEAHPLPVCADPTQMEQVLMNLCINARDAMTSSGTLTIKTEAVTIDPADPIQLADTAPGPYALLTIADTGCGIAPDVLDSIFDPFFTTKDIGKGTGLGLSMVYGIIKQNRGAVTVHSDVGHGSVFKVYLPLIEGQAIIEDASQEVVTPRGDGTVLLAEDDPRVRSFVLRLLEASGYRTLVAQDGQEAIDLFDAHHDDIDVVLLDVVMPKVGGRQVMDHIRERGATVPIIFTSGYSQDALHTGFILDQGIVLLEKPYTRQDLLARLDEAISATAGPTEDLTLEYSAEGASQATRASQSSVTV